MNVFIKSIAMYFPRFTVCDTSQFLTELTLDGWLDGTCTSKVVTCLLLRKEKFH